MTNSLDSVKNFEGVDLTDGENNGISLRATDPNKTLKILGDTGGGLNLDSHGYTPAGGNYDRRKR